MIDIHTKMVTLIGTPLEQSFAARMQNCAYEAAGINMVYFYTELGNNHLEEVVSGLRYMNFAGFAVTKPNKIRILEYLDELEPTCARTGSCNTVVRTSEGRLIGYNTDALGFYQALTIDGGVAVEGNAFFCIGAGGVGRAMCAALAYNGAGKLLITDSCVQAAGKLVDDINHNFAPIAEAVPHGDFSRIAECPVVLNASGVGMGEGEGSSPVPADCLTSAEFCFDACYNPARTPFLLAAEACGCKTMNGLRMSLYQGAAQIELWSGQKAPVDAMWDELLKILREREVG